MKPDFPTTTSLAVSDEAELRSALRECNAARLVGTGSAQHLVPAPTEPVTTISFAPMNRIVRLEADDLTCTVEAGVRREQLDSALLAKGVQLPCAGGGTIGGMFAADLYGPLAHGAHSPRSLLLGLEGMLAEGLSFKTGARVVKSVAGFDLHKLFVGSEGRLFAAVRLHLKLRPAPRCRERFRRAGLAADEATSLFHRLRRSSTGPSQLVLHRNGDGIAVSGELCGPPTVVRNMLRQHALEPGAEPPPIRLHPSPGHEVVEATMSMSRLGQLLQALPAEQLAGQLLATAGGRVQVASPGPETDAVLTIVRKLAPDAWIRVGSPARRCRAAAGDPAAVRLAQGLKQALDPRGVLR